MSKKADASPNTYDIGRGKPPRHTRFQKGRSGNPGGRKKESLNNRTILERVLNSEIVLSDHGKPRKVTVREALYLRLVQSGLAGNQRALEFALEKGEDLDNLNQAQSVDLQQDDQEILDAMLARRRSVDAADPRSCRELIHDEEIDELKHQGALIDRKDDDDELARRPSPQRLRSKRRSER